MTDDKQLDKPPGVIDGAPDVFVRGGTPTMKSERLYEERFREAEQRRNVADEEKRIGNIPIEQGGGQLRTSQLTQHPEIPKAYLGLKYVDRLGQPIVINGTPVVCCADLIIGMDPDKPLELTIILVCPKCMQGGQKHQQDAQLTIRQSNKRFEFVAAKGDPMFEHDGKMYRSAGVVVQSESFKCSDCGWKARIDNNRVWPD